MIKRRFKHLLSRKRVIWHNHFIPAIIAGLSLALIAFFLEFAASNMILFASLAASLAILAHTKSHHLTRLHTAIVSYVLAIVVSMGVYGINEIKPLPLSMDLFLVIFLTTMMIFLFNCFHPPAVSVGVSFFLIGGHPLDLLYLFFTIIVLFIGVRFLTYVVSQHLSVRLFFEEFKKEF